MFLTAYQTEFLAFLRDCLFLRWKQAVFWFQCKGLSAYEAEQALHQLRGYRKLILKDGQIICPNLLFQYDADATLLDAIDVMLRIGKENICEINLNAFPYILVFSIESELDVADFGVLPVPAGFEAACLTKLRTAVREVGTVIFLLEQDDQMEALHYQQTSIFAIPHDEDIAFYQNEI